MTMKPVLHSFAYSLDFLREQVAGAGAAEMTAQPNGIRNHPAWVIGHLTLICQLIGGVAGLNEWLPSGWAEKYGPGSEPADDPALYEDKDEALRCLADAEGRLTRAVEALDDAALDQPFPDEAYLDVFPTVRHALTQILVGHTAYHVGQVALWRKALGLPPLGRSYE